MGKTGDRDRKTAEGRTIRATQNLKGNTPRKSSRKKKEEVLLCKKKKSLEDGKEFGTHGANPRKNREGGHKCHVFSKRGDGRSNGKGGNLT